MPSVRLDQLTARVPPLVARELRLELSDALRLCVPGNVLPFDFGGSRAQEFVKAVAAAGGNASLVERPPSSARCVSHLSLTTTSLCEACRGDVCVLCTFEGRPLCLSCRQSELGRRGWKRLRVGVLLLLLVSAAAWGFTVVRRRDARLEWSRPLHVSIILLSAHPTAEVNRAPWESGARALERWFSDEAVRHGLPLPQPVVVSIAGPVQREQPPDMEPKSGGLLERAKQAWRLRSEVAEVVRRAGNVPSDTDVRVFVFLQDQTDQPAVIEGVGERGGSNGLVFAKFDDPDRELELIAIAHETLHCLGAEDTYDDAGHARVPDGLVDPPAFPQRWAEIMAGELPIAPDVGQTPEHLSTVRVGAHTASAIGWPE